MHAHAYCYNQCFCRRCYFLKLRPLRLAKIVPAFDLVMKRVHHLFSAVGNQTAILCIFIYIFTLFGCRTFGLQYVGKFDLYLFDFDMKLFRNVVACIYRNLSVLCISPVRKKKRLPLF